jgi:transcriptional regulator with XRE-family HTH domain
MLQGMLEIGAQCAEQRKAKGWTQADAAIRANLARPVISMMAKIPHPLEKVRLALVVI